MQAVLLVLALVASPALAEESNPLGKVIELIDNLAREVEADGVAEGKAYVEYVQWCKDVNRNGNNDIKTATTKIEKLTATIDKASSAIEVASGKIEDLAASIATAQSDLEQATKVREKENADFSAAEAELVDGVDTLGRAINIVEREMAKNPAALMQIDMSSMQNLVQAIGAVVEAAGIEAADGKKLVALAQVQSDDEEAGAPAAAVYKSHSGGIVDAMEDMKEKAEGELADLRGAENKAQHAFNKLKQSLEDQIDHETGELGDQKKDRAENEETKAVAEGDLTATEKLLAETKKNLATAQTTCMQVAADHQATVDGRADELKTIAKAKQILLDTTSGAVAQTYDFVQIRSSSDLATMEVVSSIKKLAADQHSASLAQLASKISAVLRYGGRNNDDVFAKVKGLIRDMIEKLNAEAEAEATEKAWCDEQTSKTTAKKEDLEGDIEKLSSKIDTNSARSAKLKEDVKELEASLAALAKEQAEMDKIRAEENAAYTKAKADLELGLTGVRKALEVLRDYYQNDAAFVQQAPPPKPAVHEKSGGAGGSIINILEVCESDFADNLAKEEQQESDAAETYEKTTQENKIEKSTMEQDVKYKTQESASLDKEIGELTADRATLQEEHAAVTEYLGQVNERCIAKPETYEERKRRREAEIAGLKEALSILNGAAGFLQKATKFLARPHY